MILEDLPRCGFGVSADTEEGIEPCGCGAVIRIHWDDGKWLYLCEEHAEEVLRVEECKED